MTTTGDGPRLDRRGFMRAAGVTAGALVTRSLPAALTEDEPLFRISLAQWSLHRTFFEGKRDAREFAAIARDELGIEAIEYVNGFFKDKAGDRVYLDELKRRAADKRVRSLLIMIDGEGALGDADEAGRARAIDNHRKWLDAAKHLGCHSIRVNAHSSGTPEQQMDRAADGLRRLTALATPMDLNVIVENHGGLSSNGAWLAGVMKKVGDARCGTLPDFGNFRIGGDEWYDRYTGVRELMPYAKAVSAKSHDFDEQGAEKRTDYTRMMKIVVDAGYRGYVGIEYEGDRLSEMDGIRATKRLLERVRAALATPADDG